MTGILNALAGAGGAGVLYVFTNATFTPGGQTGTTGPSLAQAVAGLTGTGVDAWKNNTAFFNTSSGIQLWTVPATGTYRIVAKGARGGPKAGTAGFGAQMQGDFVLNAGDKIRILAGQVGSSGDSYGGGGGGGTFVMKETGATTADIYVIAGGGGGSGYNSFANGVAGTTSNGGTSNASGDVSGGTAGSGGAAATSGAYQGAGGGGLNGNGGSSTLTGGQGPANGGLAFANGGAGGLSEGTINSTRPNGGFGGGGAGVVCGGGGGGYSGGGAGGVSNYSAGGGGGSYNNGTSQTNTAGANNGDGSVTITAL